MNSKVKLIIFCVVIGFMFVLSGCAADPAANVPKTTTSDPKTPANSTGGDKLAFSNEGSKVEFVGSKVTGKHDGGFKKFTGAVYLVNNKAEESRVDVDIDTTSVFTDADGLTEHLKTSDFFDVAKFPKASFVSTEIKAGGDKGATHTVTGNLELKGVKKSVTFPATIKIEGNAVAVQAEFAINRRDFGINYAGKANDLIRDDVVMKLNINAKK